MKNEFKIHLNKTSPHAHMESEFDVLGDLGKLEEYIVHLYKRKIGKKISFFSHKPPKLQSTSFWSQV
jgi:hypothetical protein